MFWPIKQVFMLLMSFSESLVSKCVPLNNDPCIVTPTFINLNTVEPNFFPFMISLNKCSGVCNVVDDLSKKYVCQVK